MNSRILRIFHYLSCLRLPATCQNQAIYSRISDLKNSSNILLFLYSPLQIFLKILSYKQQNKWIEEYFEQFIICIVSPSHLPANFKLQALKLMNWRILRTFRYLYCLCSTSSCKLLATSSKISQLKNSSSISLFVFSLLPIFVETLS